MSTTIVSLLRIQNTTASGDCMGVPTYPAKSSIVANPAKSYGDVLFQRRVANSVQFAVPCSESRTKLNFQQTLPSKHVLCRASGHFRRELDAHFTVVPRVARTDF
jgi:hypothetical protein